MIWYIVTFIVGVAIGVTALLFLIPRVERLWRYIDTKARQIRNLPW